MNILIISAMSDEGKNLDCEGSPYEGFTGLYANVGDITPKYNLGNTAEIP